MRLNFVVNSSAYTLTILQTDSLYWKANILPLTMEFRYCFVFLKTMFVLGHQELDLCLRVLERCPNDLYKDCHRQTSKQTV